MSLLLVSLVQQGSIIRHVDWKCSIRSAEQTAYCKVGECKTLDGVRRQSLDILIGRCSESTKALARNQGLETLLGREPSMCRKVSNVPMTQQAIVGVFLQSPGRLVGSIGARAKP